jgi:hypothetical protein
MALTLVSSSLFAGAGSYNIRYEGTAPPGSRVTVTASSEDGGATYDTGFALDGRTATEARDEILIDLRSQGWVAARKGDTGLSIISHTPQRGSERQAFLIGIVDNQVSIDTSVEQFIQLFRAAADDPSLVLSFSGELTSADHPGVAVLSVTRSDPIRVELPPSATPDECASLLHARLSDLGHVAERDGSEVRLRRDLNGRLIGSIRNAEFGIEGAEGGPTTGQVLPPQIGCETEVVLGFSLESQRGADPFEGILGVEAASSSCSTAFVDVHDPQVTIFPSIVSRLDGRQGPGVQEWSIAIAVQDGEVLEFTTAGTAAASVDDDPPGLRDLGFVSYGLVDPTRNRGLRGVAGAVTLSFIHPVTLPGSGTESMMALTIAPDRDPQHSAEIVTVRYLSGISVSALPNSNSVSIGGLSYPAAKSSAVLLRFRSDIFARGDVNADGTIDVTDGVGILRYKFLGVPFGDCISAADINDSGSINTSDAISLFSFLFLGGPPPMPPLECDVDPTSDLLSCTSFEACD